MSLISNPLENFEDWKYADNGGMAYDTRFVFTRFEHY
jgi:hypothetical protein